MTPAPIERACVRWREAVGPASIVAAPAALIAFLAIRHGLAPWTGLRAIVALYALGIVPGYLVQRGLLRIRSATPFEGLVSSLLLGTLLTPLLWFALCCTGLSSVFYPLMLLLGVTVPIAFGWHHQPVARVRRLVTASEAPVLWLAVAVAVLWSWNASLVSVRGDRVVVLPHNDHLLHTSLIAELSRGVPTEVVPFIASAGKWAYHHLPDVWCDMIRRVAGIDARDAYFHLALPLRYVFVALACYLAMVGRFGRAAATVGAGCVLALAGLPGDGHVLTNWLLTYLHWNYPCSFGLIGVFLILYFVSAMSTDHRRGPLLLISILSALLLWYKANFALAVIPAVSVFCAVVLVRARDYRWLLACLSAQVLLIVVRRVDLSSADFHATLAFEPLRFINYLWWQGTSWLKATASSGGPWMAAVAVVLNAVRRNVDALPAVLRWPTIYVLCIIALFHVGIVLGLAARVRCGFGRLRPRAHPVDGLILLILLACAVGFVVFPVQRGLVWNVSLHLFALVNALLLALMGPVVCDLVRSAFRRGRTMASVAAALLTVALAGNTYALTGKALGPAADVQDVIGKGTYDCYRYIEAATPPDALVLHPRFEQGLISAGMLTQRRVALEWASVWACYGDTKPIVSDLRAFYAGTPSLFARAILERYGVDVVVAERSLPQRAGYTSFLTEVYHSGTMAVFRVSGGKPRGMEDTR